MDKEYKFDSVLSCEPVGEFDDEYVYDVEVDDESHTFIANDILVHNSLFVSFDPAIRHTKWKDVIFNKEYLENITEDFVIFKRRDTSNNIIPQFTNPHHKETIDDLGRLKEAIEEYNIKLCLIDGDFFAYKDDGFLDYYENNLQKIDTKINWNNERSFILGIDYFRYANMLKERLEDYAASFGVPNKEDFELEKIITELILMAKKKYIGNVVYADGRLYNSLEFVYLKGVELVRSSTPLFARTRIMEIVKYLLTNPDTVTIKKLMNDYIKPLRKEFELDEIDNISMQCSMSNYESKVIEDNKLPLEFVTGTHFAVKAGAYHNHLLKKNPHLLKDYQLLKSGEKIKYYYTTKMVPCLYHKANNEFDKDLLEIFAYSGDSFPIEIAPPINYDRQFSKAILSPINAIIEPMGLQTINEKMRITMNLFN